jgi:hypothetical protein
MHICRKAGALGARIVFSSLLARCVLLQNGPIQVSRETFRCAHSIFRFTAQTTIGQVFSNGNHSCEFVETVQPCLGVGRVRVGESLGQSDIRVFDCPGRLGAALFVLSLIIAAAVVRAAAGRCADRRMADGSGNGPVQTGSGAVETGARLCIRLRHLRGSA